MGHEELQRASTDNQCDPLALCASCSIPPAPPWHLAGAATVFPLLRGRRVGVLGLVRYDASPVGPYCELLEAYLTTAGPTVTRMLVTSEASRQGGRQIWGYPKEVAPLTWRNEADGCVTFRHGHKTWRVRPVGPTLPLKLRAWTVQNLNGERVKVPCAVEGRVRLARCGRLWGAIMTFEMDIEPPQSL